jgi:AcrR family transcriptional regulator
MKSRKIEPKRGRPREFDDEAALDRAMRVFWEKGYQAASLTDLTRVMRINRPSLYAAFGNKEALFRRVLGRYLEGPAASLRRALAQPTARQVAEHLLRAAVEQTTCPRNPHGCLIVKGISSCPDASDQLARQLTSMRARFERELRKRFERAVDEGDLAKSSNPAALARFLDTVKFGLSMQAGAGATRSQLMAVVETAMKAWPSVGKSD